MTNEEAVKIVSQYNPSLEYVKACDKIKKMQQENEILKDGITALNLSLGYDDGDERTGGLSGYCVASITPQKEAFILLCGISDNQEVVDRFDKIKKMLEVVEK